MGFCTVSTALVFAVRTALATLAGLRLPPGTLPATDYLGQRALNFRHVKLLTTTGGFVGISGHKDSALRAL
jgi:hypothetical protein